MKENIIANRAGLEEQYSPRTAGQQSLHKNTDLCVDLKTILLDDCIAMLGKDYQGVLKKDKEHHYTFREIQSPTAYKRNPRIYNGKYITLTLRKDGSPQFNFKAVRLDADFNAERYALEVYNEIREALSCLVEKS